jgi:aspartate/methionine/tyrosine aminotransferase
LAEKYDLFLISDEVYANLAHNQNDFVSVSKIIKSVPLILMKGLSKEVP